MDFLNSHVSMEELLIVDTELRKARRGLAHSKEVEKMVNLEDLKEWAAVLYSQEDHPNLHGPLQKMLDILGEFTSVDMPYVPVRSFALKLHHSLRWKFW